ncbi:hypothetical protein LINPERPRIM_LOCUS17072 [Linum perenne]
MSSETNSAVHGPKLWL